MKSVKPWAIIFWLIIWQLASLAVGYDILLVSPIRVFLRLCELVPTADFWTSIAFSTTRICSGFLLGTLVGGVLAVLSARFKHICELITPLMLTIKTIPVASFIILALIWFSSKNLSVLISFLMVLPVMYTNTFKGINCITVESREFAKVFELPVSRKMRYLYIPQIFPFFTAGCEIALGLCWKSGIAAEVIGMPNGSVGEKLQQAKVYLATPDLLSWTLVIIIVSTVFEKVFLLLLKKIQIKLEKM